MSLTPQDRIIDKSNYPIGKILKGTKILAMLKDPETDQWTPFATATSNGLSTSKESMDASNKSQGGWAAALSGQKSWTGSIDGILYHLPDQGISMEKLKNLFDNECSIEFAFTPITHTGESASGCEIDYRLLPYYQGRAVMSSLDFTADNNAGTTFTMGFDGSEELSLEPSPTGYVDMTIDTTLGDGTQSFAIPTASGSQYDMTVDWGDGTNSHITSWDSPEITHTYASAGQYSVLMIGSAESLAFGELDAGVKQKITRVDNFGDLGQSTLEEALTDCTNLQYFYQGSGFESGIETIDMFKGCSSMTECVISSIKTNNADSMFYGCSSLPDLDVSGLDVSSCVTMLYMFRSCSSLTQLDLSTFDTSLVQSLSGMFRDCSSLTSIDISGFNTQNVGTITAAFYGCSSATSIDMSNFDGSSITAASSVFRDCTSLTSMDLSGISFPNLVTLSSPFRNCTSLTSVDMSNMNMPILNAMQSTFMDCTSLTSVDFTGIHIPIVTNLASIFIRCSSLVTVDISPLSSALAPTSFVSMFEDCTSLESIDLSQLNSQSVTAMQSMFSDCRALTSVNLTNFDTSSSENFEKMFNYCSSLTSIDISSFDTSNALITTSMFANCLLLTDITWGTMNFENILFLNTFLNGVPLTVNSYSAFLTNLNTNSPSLPSGKTLNAELCQYDSNAEQDRDEMEINYSWIFDDAGLAP